MRKLVMATTFTTLVGASFALFAFTGAGLADPSGLYVADVPPHRHFIQTATGERVPVGPQVCENSALMPAFEQFHHNVHHSFVPPSTTVHTLGPQDGAPGLHNGKGANIVATLC
jgi:hypothetical protein